jgi:hypothetical protein
LKDWGEEEVPRGHGNIVATMLLNQNHLGQFGPGSFDPEVNENDIGKFEVVIPIVLLSPQLEQR